MSQRLQGGSPLRVSRHTPRHRTLAGDTRSSDSTAAGRSLTLSGRAILVGNSDGIGLALTRRLLEKGWEVVGISRSELPMKAACCTHYVCDVTSPEYPGLLAELAENADTDMCGYFAGIGEMVDLEHMDGEVRVVDVNLLGMIRTVAGVLPGMVRRGRGHFIGVSSMADELLSAEAPSYHASKAGFSSYLASLALALKGSGVAATNVRFGFVDTKMAKGTHKPLMMSVEEAVARIERCMQTRPRVCVAPRGAVPLVKLRKWMMRLGG